MTLRRDFAVLCGICTLLVTAFALPIVAYWPGIMTWDAVREYGMALRNPMDDWHPPVMIWLWRQLHHVSAGPGPMLLLQLGLYAAGWALVARSAWKEPARGVALALAACSLFPIALVLEGAVLKDCLMAGALLAALGLLAAPKRGRGERILACALLLFAATLRFNALFACLPLFMAALPSAARSSWPRFAAALLVSTLVLALATPVANRLIGARPSGVEHSQILFDLGGITRFGGTDAFPPLADVPNPVEVNQSCYHPKLWDSYAWWTDSPCPIGWANVPGWFVAHRISPVGWWLKAIVRHPLAYSRHRIGHFLVNTRATSLARSDPVLPPLPDTNSYGYDIAPNRVSSIMKAAAAAVARSPLGWPISWMSAAAVILLLKRRKASRLVLLAASSSLLFGLSYAVLSVASDLRYHLWTMIAGLIAVVGSFAGGPGRLKGAT